MMRITVYKCKDNHQFYYIYTDSQDPYVYTIRGNSIRAAPFSYQNIVMHFTYVGTYKK